MGHFKFFRIDYAKKLINNTILKNSVSTCQLISEAVRVEEHSWFLLYKDFQTFFKEEFDLLYIQGIGAVDLREFFGPEHHSHRNIKKKQAESSRKKVSTLLA
jgi:hypothetical protein